MGTWPCPIRQEAVKNRTIFSTLSLEQELSDKSRERQTDTLQGGRLGPIVRSRPVRVPGDVSKRKTAAGSKEGPQSTKTDGGGREKQEALEGAVCGKRRGEGTRRETRDDR